MTQSSSHYRDYTVAALEDELVRILCSKNSADIIEEGDGSINIYIHWMYIEQAESLIYRTNICQPPQEFVIWEEDIPENLAKAFEALGRVETKRVVTDAVRRIYESVDPEYFHINGVYGKIEWKIGRCKT
jgi:hypothetical protein